MNEPNDEKKPKEPWYKQFKNDRKSKTYKKLNKPTRFDDLTFSSTEDIENDSDEWDKKKRRKGFKKDSMSEESDDEDISYDDEENSEGSESESSEPDEEFKKGFIQI